MPSLKDPPDIIWPGIWIFPSAIIFTNPPLLSDVLPAAVIAPPLDINTAVLFSLLLSIFTSFEAIIAVSIITCSFAFTVIDESSPVQLMPDSEISPPAKAVPFNKMSFEYLLQSLLIK